MSDRGLPYEMRQSGVALDFLTRADGVGLIRLNRPEAMNTLVLELLGAFEAALDQALSERLRVLIVTGSGRAFCAGAPLDYFADANGPFGADPHRMREAFVGRVIRLFDRLQDMPCVVIAAINGHALAGGCELALACDLRVMADGATIGLTETRVGILPAGGGVQKLHRIIGRARALDMILRARRIDAAEAERFGLVSARAAPEDLMATAEAIADELLQRGPRALAEAKAMIYATEVAEREAANRLTLDAFERVAASPEWREGSEAFLQRRPPRFTRD